MIGMGDKICNDGWYLVLDFICHCLQDIESVVHDVKCSKIEIQ
jgi:hypothetical protein